jgi:glycerol-3-phosphate acyltransferase PlsY
LWALAILVVVLLAAIAYLLGSIPTGYLVARWVKGIDIRQFGSGGTGATNVLRTVGKGSAAMVLVVDLLKGLAAVLLVKATFPFLLQLLPTSTLNPIWQPWLETLAGLMALIGHSRSIWLNFTGGKSAASGLGILLALSWPIGLGIIATFAITLGISRIVSLSSMAAALATIVLMVLTGQPLAYSLFALIGGGYVILRHRSNIERILSGAEPRLGQQQTSNQ